VNALPITACLIVRDEEAVLPRCLESLRGRVAEIVVLDTGSVDRTLEIARAYGAVTGTRPWDDDFAAARNASLELATQPWILAIDADEELPAESVDALAAAVASPELGMLLRLRLLDSLGGHQDVPMLRLFRNDPRIRFRRRIHESVNDALWDAGLAVPVQCDAVLVHHGYDAATVDARGKLARNLRIHRRMREAGEADAYDLLKQAQILLAPEEAGERREVLEEAWRGFAAATPELRLQWPWGGKLRALFGQVLAEAGEMSRAREVMELRPEEPACLELPLSRLDLAWRTGDFGSLESDMRHATNLGDAPAALSARTRRARCAGDRPGLEAIAASHSIEAAVWLALRDLEEGRGEAGMARLGRPMAMAPHEPVVRLASGIFLARYGDPVSAAPLFAAIDGFCQPIASAWQAALRLRAGEPAASVLAALASPSHHEAAALALETARRGGLPFAPDEAFDPGLLERRRKVWQDVLDAR
jgi:hypothetical protein